VEQTKVGLTLRAIRLKAGLSQSELAARAGVSQSTVSRIECGRLGNLPLELIVAVARALQVDLQLVIRWRGPELDRLLDARHARLVGLVAEALLARGWEVELEYSFNHYGDRGSVDVVAWQQDRAAILLVEVKTRLVDIQDLLSSMHKKRRVVPETWRAQHGMRPRHVGSVLVLPDATVHRSAVARQSAIFDLDLPERTSAVGNWLARPESDLHAIWFVRDIPTVTRKGDYAGEFRLKRRSGA